MSACRLSEADEPRQLLRNAPACHLYQYVSPNIVPCALADAHLVTLCFAITLIVVNNIEEDRDEQAREALLIDCDLEYEFDKPASVASSPA